MGACYSLSIDVLLMYSANMTRSYVIHSNQIHRSVVSEMCLFSSSSSSIFVVVFVISPTTNVDRDKESLKFGFSSIAMKSFYKQFGDSDMMAKTAIFGKNHSIEGKRKTLL